MQIIKASLLLGGVATMAIWVLAKYGFNPAHLLDDAARKSGEGFRVSRARAGVPEAARRDLGRHGVRPRDVRPAPHPHALPDGSRRARGPPLVGWAVGIIGIFYVFVAIIGLGSRAILGQGGEKLAGDGGNLAAPYLAQELGGGSGSVGGDIFFAVISAIAFATILAVVAGVVLAASGAVAHDLWANVLKRGKADDDAEQMRVARIAVVGIGAVGVALALLAGPGFNVQLLTGLTFAVAASANFPALLLALTWRRFTTTGAVVGITVGLVSSLVLIILSPPVWPGADGDGSPIPLANPAIVSVPLGFVACWLGTVFTQRPPDEERFEELRVRAETAIGAET